MRKSRSSSQESVSFWSLKAQWWALFVVSLGLLLAAPSVWHFSPDSGIYLGTAESIVREGRYYFNGHPNLLYYPGVSSLLALLLSLGAGTHALNLYAAGTVVGCLWLSRAYFSPSQYGLVGLALPLVLSCTGILLDQSFRLLSDATFLAVILGALLSWRAYTGGRTTRALCLCVVLVAVAPLVRFQGLFLVGAFGFGLIVDGLLRRSSVSQIFIRAFLLVVLVSLPFVFWTARNASLHTPDTFNMASTFFFGLKGLALYAPGAASVEWIDAEWKYPLYRSLYFVNGLGESIVGNWTLRLLPAEGVFILLSSLIALGIAPWFRRATSVEIAFVVISVAFLAHSVFGGGGRTIYVVSRYWLPVLPFLILMMSYGVQSICQGLARIRLSAVGYLIVMGLSGLLLANGVHVVREHIDAGPYFENAGKVVDSVAAYINETTPPDARVATTDWGVMPRAVDRSCYQLLDDERKSLERMLQYQTTYLVILDDLARFPRTARKMVERFPEPFSLQLQVDPNGRGPAAAVYSVDLRKLKALVQETVPPRG